jgi:hypothetical protein
MINTIGEKEGPSGFCFLFKKKKKAKKIPVTDSGKMLSVK